LGLDNLKFEGQSCGRGLEIEHSVLTLYLCFKVNKALKEQVDTLWHTTSIYMHPKIHEYAERLTATLPEPLKCVYFVNSGSEANDMAMMMAREYTGNWDIVSFRNSYHGKNHNTLAEYFEKKNLTKKN
jgi:4-aminobutyrate aminotransferase-like enzyme